MVDVGEVALSAAAVVAVAAVVGAVAVAAVDFVLPERSRPRYLSPALVGGAEGEK